MENQQVIQFQLHSLEQHSICTYVSSFVASRFPDKHITPLDFRRMIPTALWNQKEEIECQGKSLQDVLHDYALLINTSDKVVSNFKLTKRFSWITM